jgi:hypothetical protein
LSLDFRRLLGGSSVGSQIAAELMLADLAGLASR